MKDIQAFPRPASEAHQHGMHAPQEGMTLRDYFAAKAMQAFIGREDYVDTPSNCIALDAYDMANEMIKARSEA
jgi:hypothetical protein